MFHFNNKKTQRKNCGCNSDFINYCYDCAYSFKCFRIVSNKSFQSILQ